MATINIKQFSDPFKFVSWCIMNDLGPIKPINENGNENYNYCQTLFNVLVSRTINCVDASIIVHKICKWLKWPHKLGWMKWIVDEDRSIGHFICIFEYGGKYHAAQFRSSKYAYIREYNSYEEALETEANEMKESIDYKLRYHTKQLTALLGKEYLDIVDSLDITKYRQIDIIRMFSKLDPFNGEWYPPQEDQS